MALRAGLDLAHHVAHLGQRLLELLLALLQIAAILLQLLDATLLLQLHFGLTLGGIRRLYRLGLDLVQRFGRGVALVGDDGHELETEPANELDLLFILEFEAGKQEGVFAPAKWQRNVIADLQPVY